MSYKSILTLWDGTPDNRAAFDYAVDLTRKNDGHLTVLTLGIDRVHAGLYYAGASPVLLTESIEAAREDAQKCADEAEAMLSGSDLTYNVQAMVAQISGINAAVGGLARFCDLVVLPQPYGADTAQEAALILEAAMFTGHAPVLVCPTKAVTQEPRKIVIAWNESAEAMAAIRAALPFIKDSDLIDITIVDPAAHGSGRADPGTELSEMLTRHGATVSVSILAKTLPHVAEVVQRHASDIGADMIVMGAYGHSRFREAILGGATRDVLEDVSLPVLMAH